MTTNYTSELNYFERWNVQHVLSMGKENISVPTE